MTVQDALSQTAAVGVIVGVFSLLIAAAFGSTGGQRAARLLGAVSALGFIAAIILGVAAIWSGVR